MEFVDLRSDTVTKPTTAMWEAMAKADVGDDVYGEDPTINKLEKMAAEKMGKEAAIFVSSGTMGNLIAALVHCQRGNEAIMGTLAHTFLFEVAGVSALGGIMVHTVPNQADGTLLLDDIRSAIRINDQHQPVSKLVILENTANRCNGAALSAEYTQQVGKIAHENNLLLHIDGARIFNAAAVTGDSAT
jgi:threonine aldolase